MKPCRLIQSEKGSMLIQVLIIIPVFLIIIYLSSNQSMAIRKVIVGLDAATNVTIVRSNLVAYLQDNKAWSKAVADAAANTSMGCLWSHSVCGVGSNGSFQVNDTLGNLVYNAIPITSGFSNTGGLCDSFSLSNPNNACPVRVNLKWEADCNLPCAPTRVKITGDYISSWENPSARTSLNADNYHFEFFQDVP